MREMHNGIDYHKSVLGHLPPWLKGSCFQAKYWASWWISFDASKSTLGIPLFWQTCWKTFGQSFHSDEPLLFWDCQSASTFKELERYSAVTVISCFKRYCQISLLKFSNLWFLFLSFSQNWVWQWCCLFENELLSNIFVCWRSKKLILLFSVLTHQCVITVPHLAIDPLLICIDIQHPIPFLTHLFVSALDCEAKSSNELCNFSNVVSTAPFLPCSFCLELLFCNMTAVFLMLVCVVVVVLVTWNLFVLELLLE